MTANEWGTLREPTIPAPAETEPSRVAARAARSSPGAADEDLGRYGSERWVMPGYGESGPKCGIWFPESVCGDCGHTEMNVHRCGRRSCPDCWHRWANEAGVRAALRVQSFRYTQPDNYQRQAAHAVLSPPEGEVMNEREFYEKKSKAADIAKEKGFRGFSIIAHPWRVEDDTKRVYRDVDPEVGIWVWLRQNFPEKELKERIYWSPHYHIVGLTSADMDGAADSDDWVYHFIRSMKPFGGSRDEDSHEDMFGTFRYLLSHTGFPEESTKQAITWYGDLANAVFVEDATADYQIEKPSKGVRDVMKRVLESLVGVEVEEDEGGGGEDESDDNGECPVDDCDGVLIDVFDVGAYLRHNEPPPDVVERMRIARDWRLGDISPPAGLMRPTSEQDAQEAFEVMLNGR